MQRLATISLVFFGLALTLSFVGPEKKIERLVSRVWKKQAFELKDIQLPDSLESAFKVLQSIHVNNEKVGYVCYTTAFGCRIGGCPAPTNPNVQSYETFDYIAVYDKNLNILKVDIANYGGDYGYEICNPRWLRQFIGGNSGFKLNENIDGIAGATVSATFLVDDLNAIGRDLKAILANPALVKQ